MNIVTKINAWQEIRKSLAGQSVGFVPTMGNLHAGHMSLCDRSKADNVVTMVSIFVNPTQFNQSRDFDLYPRTLAHDQELLTTHGVDYLFLPEPHEMYPDQYQIQVTETELSNELEGEYRPGHFNGMLTVVLKLLNIAHADRAYFGEKDYQQFLLIKKMAAALFIPTEIFSGETVRAEDGLALSSRNARLTPEQRQHAVNFPRLLSSVLSVRTVTEQLTALNFKVDYIEEKWGRRLGAVWMGDVRLIDNVPAVEGEECRKC